MRGRGGGAMGVVTRSKAQVTLLRKKMPKIDWEKEISIIPSERAML